MTRAHPGTRGWVLPAVLVVAVALSAMAMLLVAQGAFQASLAGDEIEIAQVRGIAEAGLEHAVFVAQNASCNGYALPLTPFHGGSYQASFTPSAGSPVEVVAVGTLPSGAQAERRDPALRVFGATTLLDLQPGPVAGEDAWIDSSIPLGNWGLDAQLRVRRAAPERRALLRFDLSAIPGNDSIVSARLLLRAESQLGSPLVRVQRVEQPWVEGSSGGGAAGAVSWQQRTPAFAWAAPGGDLLPSAAAERRIDAPGWHTFDVTAPVRDWVEEGVPNQGLAVVAADPGAVDFASSDHPDPSRRPRLLVRHACECGSSSGTSQLRPGPAGMDTYLADDKNLENYGAEDRMRVSNKASRVQHGVLRFDLSPVPAAATVTSAELRLNLEGIGSGNSGTIFVHELLRSWVEGTGSWGGSCWDGASWLRYNGACSSWAAPGGDFDPTAVDNAAIAWDQPGTVTWDVTPLVQSWVDGTRPNYGMLLAASFGINHADFSSGDHANAGWHPELAIDWSCPCGAACGPSAPGFYRDEFSASNCDALDFQGSEGSIDWSPESWVEIGESNGSCSGGVRLTTDLGDESARIQGDGRGLRRPVDLSGFSTAFLTFDYRRDDFEAGDYVAVEVKDGASWIELARIEGPGTDGGYQRVTLDLSNHLTAAAEIRFLAVGLGGAGAGTDSFFVDDVHIDADGSGGAGGGGGGPSVSLPSIADTWLYEKQPTDNYGTAARIEFGLDNGGDRMRTLVRFDTSPIPPGSTVTSATLRLYKASVRKSGSYSMSAHRVTGAWDEATATWTNLGGGVFDPAPLETHPVAVEVGWEEWTIPPGLIHEWIDGISPNHGLLVKYDAAVVDREVHAASREEADPALRPELVIEYTTP